MDACNADNANMEKTEKKETKSNIIWLTFIIAAFIGGILVGANLGIFGISGMAVSKDAAAQKVISFLNTNLVEPGTEAKLVSITEENGVYKIITSYMDKEIPIFASKDGSLLFTSNINMNEKVEAPAEETQPEVEMIKTDKPKVEVFIMSHCPYGTQIEKGIIPVLETLGDKIDSEIKFVYYAMHGETEVLEQLNQYCIQKEQKDKYFDYLKCFLKEGKGESCLTEAKIDKANLAACAEKTDKEFEVKKNLADKSLWLNGRFPLFNIFKQDNEKYEVGGSPTLIINGAEAGSGRDSASLLKAVCSAFTVQPEECKKELSSTAPSPGFGAGTGDGSEASCGN